MLQKTNKRTNQKTDADTKDATNKRNTLKTDRQRWKIARDNQTNRPKRKTRMHSKIQLPKEQRLTKVKIQRTMKRKGNQAKMQRMNQSNKTAARDFDTKLNLWSIFCIFNNAETNDYFS